MSIDPVAFGENLRPSAVSLIKKVNEVIDVVNTLNPSEIAQIQTQIEALNTKTNATDTRVSGIATRVTNVESANTTQQNDIDAIKITLYTPLDENE